MAAESTGLENSHGQRSLSGYSHWGCKESDTAERLSAAEHCKIIPGLSLCVFATAVCSCRQWAELTYILAVFLVGQLALTRYEGVRFPESDFSFDGLRDGLSIDSSLIHLVPIPALSLIC